MMLPSKPSKETIHLKKLLRDGRAFIARSNKMAWLTEHPRHSHPAPVSPSPEAFSVDNDNDNDNNKNCTRPPRLILRLKISKLPTTSTGGESQQRYYYTRARRAACGGRGVAQNIAPPILEINSHLEKDKDDLDPEQDQEGSSESDSGSSTPTTSSTLSSSKATEPVGTPLRRSTRVSKKTRAYWESEDYQRSMHGGKDNDERDGDLIPGSKSDNGSYEEYFVLPGEYDPDHPEGYQQQGDDTNDQFEEEGASMSLDVERGSVSEAPVSWIVPSPLSSRAWSPSRFDLPSAHSHLPKLRLRVSSGAGVRGEDDGGYTGDDDFNSVDEDDDKDSTTATRTTQYLFPLSSIPGPNDGNNNSTDGSGDEDDGNTTDSESDGDDVPLTNTDSLGNGEGGDMEGLSIAEYMAIWGCVQYMDLEGQWDKVAIALGLESCPQVWRELEYEYNRLRELRDSGALIDGVDE